MWLIRFHKLTTREYNLVARTLKKLGFIPRRIPPIVFMKALLFYYLQKKSWRTISEELHCNYIALFNFYTKYGKNTEILEIFHTFADRRIIVYIEKNTSFTQEDLDNNLKFLQLTKEVLQSMLLHV